MNGYGEYYYFNGNKYTGEFKHNMFEGQGIMNYLNGDIFEGSYFNH